MYQIRSIYFFHSGLLKACFLTSSSFLIHTPHHIWMRKKKAHVSRNATLFKYCGFMDQAIFSTYEEICMFRWCVCSSQVFSTEFMSLYWLLWVYTRTNCNPQVGNVADIIGWRNKLWQFKEALPSIWKYSAGQVQSMYHIGSTKYCGE